MSRAPSNHKPIWMKLEAGTVVICCPRCGEGFMHQEGVQVFERKEDDRQELVVEVTHTPVAFRAGGALAVTNPSLRANGLVIRFRCEVCGPSSANWIDLTFAQHKGQTLVDWRVALIGIPEDRYV